MKIATLNLETLTGKSREIADMMSRALTRDKMDRE